MVRDSHRPGRCTQNIKHTLELAISYHQDGVVQGYELLKTDDIFLLKGVSEDGTPAFHPHIVQQNGLSVLRFLQENCKQDPGAYWVLCDIFFM